jgi:diguanylate cyclase (GGDEF)-like protein/PAS domain S-box-containing protein
MPPKKITTRKRSDAAELRRQAEGKLNTQSKTTIPLTEAEPQSLVHELRMHQIELEMQNEELRRIQLELEDARARYFDMYDLAPVGYLVLSEKGLILEANLTAASLLGVAKSALIKKPLTHFILPEDRNIYNLHRKQLFEIGAPHTCELRLVKKNATSFWVRLEATVAQGADGIPVCRAVLSDITERKKAEEALRYRAEELAALQAIVLNITTPHDLPTLLHTIVERATQLLDARSGGLYLCDPVSREAHCVVSYNTPHDYTGTILKYGEGAAGIVLQTGEPLIIDDYRVWSKRAEVFEEEQPFTTVLSAPMIRQDQVIGVIHILDDVENRHFTEIDLELLTLFAYHATNAVTNARLYEEAQNDITERKRAEESLRESEEKYRNVVEQSIMGIGISKGNQVIFANKALLKIFNYDELEEFKKIPLLDHVAPSSRKVIADRMKIVAAGKTLQPEFEYEILCKGGLTRTLHCSSTHISLGGEVYTQTTFQDITESKRAELERQVMLEIMQGVAYTKDLQEFIQLIHHSISRVIYAENFFVVFYNKSTGLFEEIFTVDKYDPRMPPSSLEKSITSYVYRTGETLLLNQMRFDELAARGEVKLVGKNFASWLGSPLKTPDEIIGVMAVQNYEIPDCYSEADKVFLTSVGAQVSLVIERKRADEALRESEQKISEALEFNRKILDTSSIGILTYNKSGQCVSANAAAAKVVGATVAQLLAQNFHEIPSWKKSGMYQAAIRALDTGIEQLLEVHIETTFGKDAWLSFSFSSFDSAGERHLLVVTSDITDRKLAEEALRYERDFAEGMIETAQAIVLVLDTQGCIVRFNPYMEEISGYALAEVQGKDWFTTFLPERDRERIHNLFLKALGDIQTRGNVNPIVTKDGRERDIEWNDKTLRDVQGNVVGLLSIGLDITEHKQVEQALRASEERYQSLFADSPVALWQEDFSEVKQQIDRLQKKGIKDFREYFAQHLGIVAQCAALVKVVDVNQAALDLHHAGSKEELLTGLNTIFGEETLPTFVEEMTTLAEGKTTFEGEFVQRTLTGDKINVAVRLSVTPGCEETWSKVLVSTTDITDRKHAEQALKEANAKLTRAQHLAHVGSWIDYLPTNQLDWSEEMYRILGFPLNTPVNLAEANRVFPPEELERFQKAFDAAIKSDVPYSTDFKIIRPDGTMRYIHDEGEVVRDEQGKAIWMLGTTQDITERKQAEKLQDAIYRIAQAADRSESLEALYPAIHAIIQEVMIVDNFYIALYDVMNDLLSFPYFVDEVDHVVPPKKTGKGLTEYVLRTGKSLLCDEALFESLKQRGEIELVGAPSPIWLGVPLIAEGKAIGVMAVQDYKNARAYAEREQRILEFVSSQTAMAIHRKQAEEALAQSHEQLRALSLEDELTSLYNRRGFLILARQQLKTVYRARRSMVLLFADLDGLKQINDTLGHREGDLALIETAAILKETFREADILTRLGGDEFGVLALETSENSAETITSRLRIILNDHNAQEGRRYSLSLSLGVAIYDPENPSTIEELLAQADAHMYEQRQSCRSRGKKRWNAAKFF